MKKSVINVIVNFLNDQSSVDELEFLLEWIKDSDNYELFTQYISIHHFSNWAMNKADQEKIIKEIKLRINTEKARKDRNFSFKTILKYAAIITISIGVGYYNQIHNSEKEINKVVLDPNKVTLNTSNGNQIILENLDDKIIKTDDQILIKKESKKIVFD